jgi:hypothetical protein
MDNLITPDIKSGLTNINVTNLGDKDRAFSK